VREDFLDEKKALDEVEPYIFGILQMVERDSFDRAEASASSVHEDCMAVRREWSRWYFGDKPDIEEVLRWKGLSNDEKFEEGILMLKRSCHYAPCEEKYFTDSSVYISKASNTIDCNDSIGIYDFQLSLCLSDIFQRYAESCYVPRATAPTFDNKENLSFFLCLKAEVDIREAYYRDFKLLYHKVSVEEQQKNEHLSNTTLNSFDGVICKHMDTCREDIDTSSQRSQTNSSFEEYSDSLEWTILQNSRCLFGKLKLQHNEKAISCLRNQLVKEKKGFRPQRMMFTNEEDYLDAIDSIDKAIIVLREMARRLPASNPISLNSSIESGSTTSPQILYLDIALQQDVLDKLSNELSALKKMIKYEVDPMYFVTTTDCIETVWALECAKRDLMEWSRNNNVNTNISTIHIL
jgi:hypothetical protein